MCVDYENIASYAKHAGSSCSNICPLEGCAHLSCIIESERNIRVTNDWCTGDRILTV
jgi:hypothetical protein